MDFKTSTTKDVMAALDAPAGGLSAAEAKRRLERDGPNAIEEKKTPFWRKALSHFLAPMALVILAAGLLSVWIGHDEDAAVIFFLYLLNGSIGIYIQRKADGALAKLSEQIHVTARCRRDGQWGRIPAAQLAAGDLVELDGGDVVPADVKIIEGEVEIDQSALTGESLPVADGAGALAYASGLVQRGHAKGVVVLTGARTTFGKTAQLAQMQRPTSLLDKSIFKIGQYLVALAIIGAVVVVGVGVLRDYTLSETALLGLTLLVASVPAAMPAVLATIMATGAMKMAEDGVVVRQLSSLEELAGVTVICSDKTGTLTQNKLSVGPVWTRQTTHQALLLSACACMPADSSDAIDAAIASRAGAPAGHGVDGWKAVRYIPADGERKRATMLLRHSKTGAYRIVIKGAPQKVLALCKLPAAARKEALGQVEAYAKKGFRTIAVAQKPLTAGQADGSHPQLKELDEEGAALQGLITLADEPRPDAGATIAQAKKMGVQVRMVTGDHAAAARYIASKIGMKGEELTSSMMEKLKGAARAARLRAAVIYSEVLPEQKYDIVKALQEGGEIVAVTGDGVNDAPALKRAAAGVAVAGANEVARSAADLVLTRPGLSVIVNGIHEGRAIFERMKHYVKYRMAETFRVLFLVVFAILALGFFPLTPIQLVALSLLNDIPILAMATDNVNEAPAPEKWKVRRMLGISTALGAIGLVSSALLLYLFYFIFKLPIPIIQTLLFLKLSVSGHLMVFHARTKKPVLTSDPPSRMLLSAVVITQLIATGMALGGIFVAPVDIGAVVLMWAWVVLFFFLTEGVKYYAYVAVDALGW
ncbi:MAG: plasma-membrane proton-efflux P-type ATPase [Candidatus Micrarchaeota archaeon]|nr:plasma-membrane proton-efflux P-type ATPase [Candidatus Micrarchaeota archaeon]